MKYQNKSNGVIAELVQENTKFKTVDLIKENGTQTTISQSTFKRWWKAIPEEEQTIEEQSTEEEVQTTKPELVQMPGTEDPDWGKKQWGPEEEVAGDGTPLAEVGKEIAEQAKQKAKKAKSGKKKTSTDVKALIDHVNGCVEFVGGKYKKSKADDTKITYTLPGIKQTVFYVRVQKSSIRICTKDKFISSVIKKQMTVTNQTFNCRYKVEELNDETKKFVDELIDDILENRKKEEN